MKICRAPGMRKMRMLSGNASFSEKLCLNKERILEKMMNAIRTTRRSAAGTILGLALASGMVSFAVLQLTAEPAAAQARGPVQRVVMGKVEDKSGAGIKGAVVYLRDGRTSAVKSAITEDNGTYRFVQLSQGVDYELWAQSDEKKSKSKNISSFDSKNDFTINLTIDK